MVCRFYVTDRIFLASLKLVFYRLVRVTKPNESSFSYFVVDFLKGSYMFPYMNSCILLSITEFSASAPFPTAPQARTASLGSTK